VHTVESHIVQQSHGFCQPSPGTVLGMGDQGWLRRLLGEDIGVEGCSQNERDRQDRLVAVQGPRELVDVGRDRPGCCYATQGGLYQTQ
jgi:hypothetical protein